MSSGITATPDILAAYLRAEAPAAEPEPVLGRLAARIPPLGMATWISVLLMALCVVGLVLGGVLAVYDWTTPGAEMPLFFTTLGLFLGAIAVQVIAAVGRQWFLAGDLGPSPAVSLRGRPQLDGVTRTVVALLTIITAGLVLGGILAIYDWTTPGVEMPLFFTVLGLFVLAVVLKVLDATVRHFQRR
jgi:hypothetical protein